MTLSRNNASGFWSSGPSDTADSTESLIYEISGESPTLVHSITMAIFDPGRIQNSETTYPPKQVKFLLGSSPTDFHFQSEAYLVSPDTDLEQQFVVFPKIAVGRFLKVLLIGKPTIQDTDKKHYIAIRYVGVAGTPLLPPKKSIPERALKGQLILQDLYASKG